MLVESKSTNSKNKQDEYLVEGLEDVVPAFGSFEGKIYSGTISSQSPPNDESYLMFFMFEPDNSTSPDALTIWLNGGPGCSSFAGLLFENSPVTTPHQPAGFYGQKEQEPLEPNEYSWTKASTILYLEQPHGSGFSKGPEPKDEHDLSRDFYNFLQNFYDIFPRMRSKRLFIFGESYAGMYVPSMAHYIHEQNKRSKREHINLQGIALGNGWVDATVQGPAVIDYAWWHGLIDSTTKKALHEEWDSCRKGQAQKEPFHDFTVPDECGILEAVVTAAGGGLAPQGQVNIYDVSTWDGYPVLLSLNGTLANFFNLPEVQKKIHAPDIYWEACVPGAGRRRLKERSLHLLDNDKPVSVMPYVADLLDDAKIQVLFYNADRDMSTCAQGTEMLLDDMSWSGDKDWKDPYKTRRALWLVDGEVAGYARPLKNLAFVIVYNSGHLAPYNQPKTTLDLVSRMLSGKSFADKALPVFAPSNRSEEESTSKSGSTRWIIFGFLMGAGFMLAAEKWRKRHKRYNYEPVSEVESTLSI